MNANPQPLILLPVDGSESSLRAAEFCAEQARLTGARVLVLNVEPEIQDWQTHGIGRASAERHLHERAERKSMKAIEILDRAAVAHDFLLAYGEPAETIGRVADEKACAAVIMGTRGLGKVAGVVVGSVAMKAFHLVKVPLTFVR